MTRLVASALAALIAAPAMAQDFVGQRAAGDIMNRDGEMIGSVTAAQTDSGIVLITIQATELSPGTHGVHIHETGRCEGDFSSAGGHYGHEDSPHGLVEGGPHAGDLPNGFVGEDGVLSMQAFNDRVTVGELVEGDGASLIIHSGADDYVSQPSGAAGDRVACAVLDVIPAAIEN